jgi:hypothetical protein
MLTLFIVTKKANLLDNRILRKYWQVSAYFDLTGFVNDKNAHGYFEYEATRPEFRVNQ